MTLIQITFLIIYLAGLITLALFGLHRSFLIYQYFKYRNVKIPTPPKPKVLPEVTVQLPIYNERYVVKRLLKSIVQLDYPRDKLVIQVLDDSTDMTVKLVHRLVSTLSKQGFRISHVQRPNRIGYKAGALEYGLKLSDSEFIAVFDADFIPQPDFLRKIIPHFKNQNIGMVQARWGHINRNYSLLTRLEAMLLDGHFVIEQLARNRSGNLFNFNGTAGVWRRQAITDAGGWEHDTLTEDVDLSFRSQLAGWKFLYLTDLVAPAELPVMMNAYRTQQHRWAKGSIQTLKKLGGKLWRAKLPLTVRLEAIFHLCSYLSSLFMIIPVLLILPMLKIHLILQLQWVTPVYFIIFLLTTVSMLINYLLAVKVATGRIWPYILDVPWLMGFAIGMSVNNAKAVLEGLFGKSREFKRTPKFNIQSKSDTWRNKKYRSITTNIYMIELLLGVYFTFGIIYLFFDESFRQVPVSLPFLMLFQFGFFYIATLSHQSDRRKRSRQKSV